VSVLAIGAAHLANESGRGSRPESLFRLSCLSLPRGGRFLKKQSVHEEGALWAHTLVVTKALGEAMRCVDRSERDARLRADEIFITANHFMWARGLKMFYERDSRGGYSLFDMPDEKDAQVT